MTTPRMRATRRAQAAVVGLGVAGALGTAVALGLTTATADAGPGAQSDTDDSSTGQPTRPDAPDSDWRDDGPPPGDQGRLVPGPSQEPPDGGSHGTTSGS
jgi:hypothetical protein